MIRVLHFARFINRHDIIDTVLTEVSRDRFEVASLTASPPNNRAGGYNSDERYRTKCLNIEFARRNYATIYSALKSEIEEFRPHILQTHHFDESVMGAILSKVTHTPAFVIGHHYSDHIYVLTKGAKRAVYLGVEKLCNKAADKVVVPTQEVYDLLIKQGNRPEKVQQIPFGVDIGLSELIDARHVEDLRNEFGLAGKFVAFVGCRLSKEKGLKYLLNAVPAVYRKFPDFRLVIAGEGSDENELRALSAELGIGDITQFIGWRMDTLTWYALCDVVIQPSLAESFGQTLTEALTFEKPVIMTPVGVAPEIIVNDVRGGELVPVGDSDAIGAALTKMIADPALRKKLGSSGRAYVAEHLSTAVAAKHYENLYQSLAKGD